MDPEEVISRIKGHLLAHYDAVSTIQEIQRTGTWETRILEVRPREGRGIGIDIYIDNESIAVNIGGEDFLIFDNLDDIGPMLVAITKPIERGYRKETRRLLRSASQCWPPYGPNSE